MKYLVCVRIKHFSMRTISETETQVASFIAPPLSENASRLLAAVGLFALGAAMQAQTATAHFSGAQTTFSIYVTYPYGLAVDAGGNIYVADNYSGTVSIVSPPGSPSLESVFGLNGPFGIAVDTQGNLYITEDGVGDSVNDVVKETLVPTTGGYTYTPSVLSTSGLNTPYGIAVDAHGNVYIADGDNGRIVKETPSGSTYIQSTLPTSVLSLPMGVAVDTQGNVYIADLGNDRVLKETPSGTRYTESTVVDHLLKTPVGVAVDAMGNVYVLGYTEGGYAEDYIVLKETPSPGGYTTSIVSFSPIQNPYGMAVDASGNIYIASPGGNRLEKLAQGAAGDFGPVNIGGTTDFPISLVFTVDTAGTLGNPAVLTQGLTGLDFANANSSSCGNQGKGYIYYAGEACGIDVNFQPQFSGARYGAAVLQGVAGNALASGYVFGTGVGSQISFQPARRVSVDGGLDHPSGLVVDPKGNVFFAESGSGTLDKETRSGNGYLRTTVAAGLNNPTAVAMDGRGNLYVTGANAVYKETLLAGSYTQSTIVTNVADPVGIAVDGSGNLYVTSSTSGNVHKESLGANGSYTASSIGFGIKVPQGVALDGIGNVFVSDPQQGTLYKETLQTDGSYRQTTLAGGLAGAGSLALDGGGNVYVIGSTSGEVYKEALQADGSYVQTIAATGLNGPRGIALDVEGDVYVSLDFTGQLEMIDVVDPPVLNFNSTRVGSTSSDSPKLVTVSNIGNSALAFPYSDSGINPAVTTGFNMGAATTCPQIDPSGPAGNLNTGSSCVYAINYAPVASGPVRGSLVLMDTSLNQTGPYAKQTIELRQGVTSDLTRTTLRVTPDQIDLGLGVTLTATVADTTTASIVPEGGSVTFTDTVSGKAVVLNGGVPVPLSGGKATLNISPKVAGEHTITAHYSGVNASFVSSTSEAALAVYR
jgi:sugar lactone lactonase YvrE